MLNNPDIRRRITRVFFPTSKLEGKNTQREKMDAPFGAWVFINVTSL